MKMNHSKMKELLSERLQNSDWILTYDDENEQLRVEDRKTHQGINISIPTVVSKWEDQKEKSVDEIVYYVEEAMKAIANPQQLGGREKDIFPVIRSASFPTKTKDGKQLIFDEHTAETNIFYALDLGTSYRLIDVPFAKQEGWDEEKIKQAAQMNIRSLQSKIKEDHVAGNTFYFIRTNDGYDASRILNDTLLEQMERTIKGTMAVAIPHQDVLIIADIRNDQGFTILGQMAMQFFAEGKVPITALPFLYENKEFEPIFVFVQKKKSHSSDKIE